MATRIQTRRGVAADWATANPVLAEGEPGYEVDTKRQKIGDGASAWNTLPYLQQPTVHNVLYQTGADDTAKAQAALDKCRDAGGGEVFVPPTALGQPYRWAKLTIYRNTTLRFAPGVVVKRKTNTFGLVNYAAGINPLLDNTNPYSGHGNIKVIGGTWDGAVVDEPYTAGGFDLFYFVGCENIEFVDITVKDVLNNHALDLNGVKNVRVTNCRFLGFKDVSVAQNLNYVEAIQYTQNIDETIPGASYMLGTPSTDIVVDDCTFGASGTIGTQAWNAGFGNHTSSNDPLSNDITIKHCKFNGMSYAGVVGYTYNDVKLLLNTFNGCAFGVRANNFSTGKKWNKTTGTWDTGLGTRMETSGYFIQCNKFNDTTNTDISILGTTADVGGFWATCNDIEILGNIMKATTTAKRSGQNIRLLLCKAAKIVNNECNNAAEGILVDTCVTVDVSTNYVYNTTTYGIRCVKQVTPPNTDAKYAVANKVVNNHVERAGSHGIGLNSVYFATAVNNTVLEWGNVSTTANGILVSGSDLAHVDANTLVTARTGIGTAISLATATTNTTITLTNKISKPDGQMVVVGTGAGNTYGNLTYTVG